jgi:PAS domain S-box-containing protein
MELPEHLDAHFRKALLETIPCAVFLLDQAQRVIYANPFSQDLTGYTPEEIIGKTCQGLSLMFSTEQDPEVLRTMCPFGRNDAIWNEQLEIRRKDGRHLPVVRKAQPVLGDDGRTIGAIQILVDVSVIKQARSEIRTLEHQVAHLGRYGEIVGSGEQMRKLFEAMELVAPTDAAVIIQGETGTGKELVARTLHTRSPRKEQVFLPVNCGALPEGLIEAELFGHAKGAFTGAVADRAGRFEQADGGTLFLDEVAELPLSAQVKLLRVIQQQEVTRVGEGSPRPVDVRILAATHRDLQERIRTGAFREDLYYRLNVVTLHVPPLRDRREDIPQLIRHFCSQLNRKYDRDVSGCDAQAMDLLLGHPWPGNVRQLENALEHAFALTPAQDRSLQASALPAEIRQMAPAGAKAQPAAKRRQEAVSEDHQIRDALAAAEGNKTRAAEILGLSRAGLYKKLKRLGIDA